MLGVEGAKGRDNLVQQDNGSSGSYGLRAGKWKLQRHDKKSARNVKVETELANTKVPNYQLFDLSVDPAEKKNVIAANPEVADQLQSLLQKIIDDGRSRK